MTTCERSGGFTLLELVVVLGVLGILLGAAAPLAGAAIDAGRRQEVQGELGVLAEALDSHYFERASFPADLGAPGFVGVHLQPGVAATAVADPFAAGAPYRYSVDAAAGTASVWSIGENGRDEDGAGDDYVLVVHAAVPGLRRTTLRFRVIVERLAEHIESGGSVAGDWPTLRAALGLGTEYERDGWGVALAWTAATYTLRSAGPDRVFGSADDITL